VNFFFQQGCIIDTCKSELMLDFGLAPCMRFKYHIFGMDEFLELSCIMSCVLWSGEVHYVTYICKWFVFCTIFKLLALNQTMKCQLGLNDLMKPHVGHVIHCKLFERSRFAYLC
jgi:hypothetical protein